MEKFVLLKAGLGFVLFVGVSLFFYSPAIISGLTGSECVSRANYLDVLALNGAVKLGECIDAVTKAKIKPQLSGRALEYLLSLPRPANRCRTNEHKNLERLSADFKICAAQFIKAYTDTYGVEIRINSAYRDIREQQCVCKGSSFCGTPGQSNHQRGVAMDVSPLDGNFARLHEFARKNPGLGVCFPFSIKKDKFHLLLGGLKGSKEGASCARQGITSSCTGQTEIVRSNPAATPAPAPPTRQTADKLRKLLAGKQEKAQCEALAAECKRTLSQTCLSKYNSQCQGGSASPAPSGGGGQSQPSQTAAPKAPTKNTSVSEPSKTKEKEKDEEKKSTEPKVVTATLEPAHAVSAEAIFGKEENPFTKRPSTTTQEIIDRLTKISEGSFQSGTTISGATRIHSIEVPLPELVDVATVFEQRQNIEIKNIEYLSDGVVSIEVQLREPDGSSGVSGFFSAPEETFVSSAYNEGPIDRLCKERPWSGLRITSFIVTPVFDSVCLTIGAQLGDEDFIGGYGE